MKLFDVIGGLVVGAWLIVGGLYVYQSEIADPAEAAEMGGEFVMEAGDTWLLIRREDDDVGFVHQRRTRLTDGWLVEYDMLMTIELLGIDQAIDTAVKSRLDQQGYVEQVNAEVSAAGRDFHASAQVDGTTVQTSLNLAGTATTKTLQLQQRPRLSASAFNQLLASGNLEAGDTYKDQFFDPTTMRMTDMVLQYKGKKSVDVYGQTHRAHHIVQSVAGNTLDVYVDDKGDILIQEFPMRMVGARVPDEFGRTKAAALRKKLEKQRQDRDNESDGGPGIDLNSALDMLKGKAPKSASSAGPSGNADSDQTGSARPDTGVSDTDDASGQSTPPDAAN